MAGKARSFSEELDYQPPYVSSIAIVRESRATLRLAQQCSVHAIRGLPNGHRIPGLQWIPRSCSSCRAERISH